MTTSSILYFLVFLAGGFLFCSCGSKDPSVINKELSIGGFSLGDHLDTSKYPDRIASFYSIDMAYVINDSMAVYLDDTNKIWAVETDFEGDQTFTDWQEKLNKYESNRNVGGFWRLNDGKTDVEIVKSEFGNTYYLAVLDTEMHKQETKRISERAKNR